ncbi:carbohydrate binding domain cbm49 protein [Acanthamoeba castellanii str. Neff]|uniref:Carbohydrate binding domain cbm49 protein n=1 Tax=Acanthamoeba castellanii (strain ATCC 30010 / Neff) TaxID=1257118 RepID=L8GUY9_ACACF|nr:carbohydrate binding domain cbm49 protein [Acanthamoeba castellanii str. Neff]ELR16999.1 carbohydrate binding domain cbm49 protein [Acanthamoeba castellanii str. Neff]
MVFLECKPLITQTKQTSWTDGSGVQYSVWDAFITAQSAPLTSVTLSLDAATGAQIDQVWEMVQPVAGVPLYTLPAWRLQNGGVPAGQTHRFGYTIRSAQPAPFDLSSWSCSGGGSSPSASPVVAPSASASPAAPLPSASPSSQPSNPSPSASPAPLGAVCSAVLVIDNYIVRNLPQLSAEQIKAKYLPYFEDVSTYYETAFGIRINFDHVYVEATGSFTDAQDGGQLLDDFEAALQQGRFGNPTDACLYHLLTGRQPAGVGGLGWIGSACGTGPAFSVDGQANEDPELVIRRAIHEIGHNLGGNHPDAYPAEKGYTCSINEDRAYDRILRSDKTPAYNFLSPTAFISDCASQSIKASVPSFTCMWPFEVINKIYPRATLCTEPNAAGECLIIAATYGTAQCYNVLPINDAASSFSIIAGVRAPNVVRQQYSFTMPPGFDNMVTSFRFIVQ